MRIVYPVAVCKIGYLLIRQWHESDHAPSGRSKLPFHLLPIRTSLHYDLCEGFPVGFRLRLRWNR